MNDICFLEEVFAQNFFEKKKLYILNSSFTLFEVPHLVEGLSKKRFSLTTSKRGIGNEGGKKQQKKKNCIRFSKILLYKIIWRYVYNHIRPTEHLEKSYNFKTK